MANLLYVDHSNVWIEAMRVAAAKHRQARDVVQQRICEYNWTIDFGKLFEFAGRKPRRPVKKRALFGSEPPKDDSLCAAAKRNGFDVATYTLTSLTMKKNRYRYRRHDDGGFLRDSDVGQDEMTLAAEESDYVPPIENPKKPGIPVHVVFWEYAARELKEVATRFINLGPIFSIYPAWLVGRYNVLYVVVL